jgi:hypothetical protein
LSLDAWNAPVLLLYRSPVDTWGRPAIAASVSLVVLAALAAVPGGPPAAAESSSAPARAAAAAASLPAPEAIGEEVFDVFEVAATPAGLVAAWFARGGRLMVAERPDGGGWTTPVDRSEPPGSADSSDVEVGATPGGTVIVVWQADDPDDTGQEAVFARVRRPGGTWGPAEQVSRPADSLRRMDLAVAGERALLTWAGSDDGTGAVRAADWTAASGWGDPVQLSDDGLDSGFMTAALADDGSAVVAFETYPGSSGDSVIAATTRAALGAWGDPEPLSRAGAESYDAQVAIEDDRTVHALWVLYADPAEVQHVSGEAGVGWKEPETITTSPADDRDFGLPRLAVAGDDLVTAWVTRGEAPAGTTLTTSVRTAGAAEWSDPATLGSLLSDDDFGGFAVDRLGSVTTVWSAPVEGRVARYRSGLGWDEPRQVGLPSDAAQPQVTVDDRGRIAVALVDDDERLRVSGPYVELPTAAITQPRAGLSTDRAARLTYRSTSSWSDLAGAEAQSRRTVWNERRPQAWRPVAGTGAPSDSGRVRTPGGSTHCLRVRAVDDLGNVGPFAQRCVTTPVDDRELKGDGWRTTRVRGSYGRTLTTSTRKGAALTARGARARTVALLVRRSPRAGKVAVFQGRTRLGVVSLAGRRSAQAVVPVRSSGKLRAGTIRIVVTTSGRPVDIDGVFLGR